MEFGFEKVHLAVLILTAFAILYSDHKALVYIRGKVSTLDMEKMRIAHRLVWTGLSLMIATGVILIAPYGLAYFSVPVFQLKMGFVGLLVINGFFIGHVMRVAGEKSFSRLTVKEKTPLVISGVISTIGWFGAATIGLFFL